MINSLVRGLIINFLNKLIQVQVYERYCIKDISFLKVLLLNIQNLLLKLFYRKKLFVFLVKLKQTLNLTTRSICLEAIFNNYLSQRYLSLRIKFIKVFIIIINQKTLDLLERLFYINIINFLLEELTHFFK